MQKDPALSTPRPVSPEEKHHDDEAVEEPVSHKDMQKGPGAFYVEEKKVQGAELESEGGK